MARYIKSSAAKKSEYPARFEKVWNIGEKPVHPGIYECTKCLYEDVINRECEKLPPCSNCKEKGNTNTWQLQVMAQNAPST